MMTPELLPQEQKGNYNFTSVRPVCTNGFMNAFGAETLEVAFRSLKMIQQQHPNADYLQVFVCNGTKYYCISDFRTGDKASDYEDTPYLYCTFLLPNEY